jgi:SAM-dependent methyltransferase
MSDVLDVGCGNAKVPGATGLDINPRTQADILHDIDTYPWPLADNSFDRVVCRHVVEHVGDVIRFVEEMHRVGRPGALIEITTPHFSSRYAYTDPTHRRYLSLFSFDYFVAPEPVRLSLLSRALETVAPVADFYSNCRLAKRCAHLRFARPFRLLGIEWLANRFPYFYEAYLAFILPARDLFFTLEVVK